MGGLRLALFDTAVISLHFLAPASCVSIKNFLDKAKVMTFKILVATSSDEGGHVDTAAATETGINMEGKSGAGSRYREEQVTISFSHQIF